MFLSRATIARLGLAPRLAIIGLFSCTGSTELVAEIPKVDHTLGFIISSSEAEGDRVLARVIAGEDAKLSFASGPDARIFYLALDEPSLRSIHFAVGLEPSAITLKLEPESCAEGRLGTDTISAPIPAGAALFLLGDGGFVSVGESRPDFLESWSIETPLDASSCGTPLSSRAFGATAKLLQVGTPVDGVPVPQDLERIEIVTGLVHVFRVGDDHVLAQSRDWIFSFGRGEPFSDDPAHLYKPWGFGLVDFDVVVRSSGRAIGVVTAEEVFEKGRGLLAEIEVEGGQIVSTRTATITAEKLTGAALAPDSGAVLVVSQDGLILTATAVGGQYSPYRSPNLGRMDEVAYLQREAKFAVLGIDTVHIVDLAGAEPQITSEPIGMTGLREIAASADGELYVTAIQGRIFHRNGPGDWEEIALELAPSTASCFVPDACGRTFLSERAHSPILDIEAGESTMHFVIRQNCQGVASVRMRDGCPRMYFDEDARSVGAGPSGVVIAGSEGLLLELSGQTPD